MSTAKYCWVCGKKLTVQHGVLQYRSITPKGCDEPVRVHVICAKNDDKDAPAYAQSGVRNAVHKYLGDKS